MSDHPTGSAIESILIVGGGVTAIAAAQCLRELGFDGRLRILSAESTIPYERPTLSKSFLLGAEDNPPAITSMETLADLEIELELRTLVTKVNAADHTIATDAGEQHAYTRLLLATGAGSRRLGLVGEDLRGVHHLREVDHARALRDALRPGRRVAVVGGGVIGLEVAAAAVQRGCEVAVVEVADCVMARVLPASIGSEVARLHQAQGVHVLIGASPKALTGDQGCVTGVQLVDGRTVPADAVVIGVGSAPNTDLAEQAGLATRKGVIVDERFRTSHPDIFAAGDVAVVPHVGSSQPIRTESWQPAQDQGRLAAAGMLDVVEEYVEPPWMWSDQYDASIQATGFGLGDAELICCGGMYERTGVLCLAVQGNRVVGAYGVSHGAGVGKAIRTARLLIRRGIHVDTAALRANRNDITSVIVKAARREARAAS